MSHSKETIDKIIKLKSKGMKSRDVAEAVLGKRTSKSTVNDIYNRYLEGGRKEPKVKTLASRMFDIVKECELLDQKDDILTFNFNYDKGFELDLRTFIETSKGFPDGCTHLVIPDTQMKPDISTNYLKCIGEYIVDKKPDVIIHLGDHADMPSLSTYDKGKGSAEGKRVKRDIESAKEGMRVLLEPLRKLQEAQRDVGEEVYKPQMVLTLGNHEYRINRYVDSNPELQGFLSIDSLGYKELGWDVYDFLDPVTINGVAYVHFLANPFTGKPYGGSAQNILGKVGKSVTVGHKQTLDVATRFLPTDGTQQWLIVAGACYVHSEDYKGHQGNHHWRGVIVKHQVSGGSYNPMFVDLNYLEKRYGTLQ